MAKTMTDFTSCGDPWQDLANAIVAQAAADYRSAKRRLKKNPESVSAAARLRECERFFLSEWIMALTDIDGSYLLNRLKGE